MTRARDHGGRIPAEIPAIQDQRDNGLVEQTRGDLPLSECMTGFWSEQGSYPEPAESTGRQALLRYGRPGLTIRGRNLATLLAPAYAAFTHEAPEARD